MLNQSTHSSVGSSAAAIERHGAPRTIDAAEPRLNVYIFGAEDCSFCRNARTFLRKFRNEKGGFDLHEFDVVRSGDDAALFVRFITAAGMHETHIPMVIIGRQIMLGYNNDATSGQENAARSINAVLKHVTMWCASSLTELVAQT